MIIGLSGYARVGKDEVAKVMVEERGFHRLAFADKLRESVYALNPIVHAERGFRGQDNFTKDIMPIYLQDVIGIYGWDGVKATKYGPEVRRLLQRFGTEAGRNLLGQNIWVNATFVIVDQSKNYVVTDCRFNNEAEAIVAQSGQVWRVQRPGVGPLNNHVSEIGLDNWPFNRYINNRGSLSDLKTDVLAALDTVLTK